MKITSYKGTYKVDFTDNISATLSSHLRASDVLVVDDNVRELHSSIIQPLLDGHQHNLVKPTESLKSYRGAENLISALISNNFRKNHRLVAIGGGVTQDVTAFVASIIYRGVDWLFVPTNLLSQCDSCIGSKTSINFAEFKNQLGGFYPPTRIIIDSAFLKTLPEREIRSGLGEIMHYFFISGRDDFKLISAQYDQSLHDIGTLKRFIERSLSIKRDMIQIDEFDKGPRNIFNYGHSFGHAIESYTNYSIPHGIAVSFGMDIANHLSANLGHITHEETQEMRDLLSRNWQPDQLTITDQTAYVNLLRKDKKNVDNEIRLILTKGIGNMFVASVDLDDIFFDTLTTCFEYYSHT